MPHFLRRRTCPRAAPAFFCAFAGGREMPHARGLKKAAFPPLRGREKAGNECPPPSAGQKGLRVRRDRFRDFRPPFLQKRRLPEHGAADAPFPGPCGASSAPSAQVPGRSTSARRRKSRCPPPFRAAGLLRNPGKAAGKGKKSTKMLFCNMLKNMMKKCFYFYKNVKYNDFNG